MLLFISDARQHAARAIATLTHTGAAEHLIAAAQQVEASLADAYRRLMQSTHFASPDDST